MDMDPMTRREAAKVEDVLADLFQDLHMLSLLPEEFSSWVRDEAVVAAHRRDTNLYLSRYANHVGRKAEASRPKSSDDPVRAIAAGFPVNSKATRGGSGDSSSSGGSSWVPPGQDSAARETVESSRSSFSSLATEEEEERQRAVKASCFVYAASHYGDPTDNDGNEAVLQVSDYAMLEHDLLESATTTGFVEPADLQTHHLSSRALIDTLQEGGYGDIAEYFVKYIYAPTSAQWEGYAADPSAAAEAAEKVTYDRAYQCGMLDENLHHLSQLVHTLQNLIHQRNQSTVNEDIHRYQLLHDAVNRDQAGSADVQVLNQRYLEVKAARLREVAALDQDIRALEEEVLYVQRSADVELEALQKVQENAQEQQRSSLRQQFDAHRRAADEVARRLQQAQTKTLNDLNTLRSNRTKREAAVSGAITEYDAQSALLHAAYTQFNGETEAETEKIVALEETLQKLHKERDEHAWEMTVAEQREEHKNVIRERQEHDARVIQAYYRAFVARLHATQELEKSSKKRKKKGSTKK